CREGIMRPLVVVMVIAVSGLLARAQTPSAGKPPDPPKDSVAGPPASGAQLPPPEHRWRLDLTAVNLFDGNINHDPVPLRSYGFTPAAAIRYDSRANEPAFTFGYEIAGNTYTGTD